MLKSMTGFGKAIYEDEQVRIHIEIKTLNAKYADISLQIPKAFNEYTLVWKNLITSKLHRGKIELNVSYDYKQKINPSIIIQEPLFKAYYSMLESLANEVGASSNKIFQLALKSPGVMISRQETEVDETLQKKIENTLEIALQKCNQTREQEGMMLAQGIGSYLEKINQGLVAIEQLDATRSDTFKSRLLEKLHSIDTEVPIDELRLEQELVYYLDKIDITEEKVRLASHLSYFDTVMKTEELAGRKLSFIVQEISRELNTLGVKANHATVQKHIIIMKNELEKIKEQLQNIL